MKRFKIRKRVFSFSKTGPETTGDQLRGNNGGVSGGDSCAVKISIPGLPGERKTRDEGGAERAAHLRAGADEKLLESFRTRKNAELEEQWKRSEYSQFPGDGEGTLRELFVLTRIHLASVIGPLNERSLMDDTKVGQALERIHRRLPLPIRLIFWKKRYVQFMLDNRDRLIR